jgi:hypothetical protein
MKKAGSFTSPYVERYMFEVCWSIASSAAYHLSPAVLTTVDAIQPSLPS